MADIYVVTGVTGRTGAATARALLAAGKQVRVVLRDVSKGDTWLALGAEVALADFNDHASLVMAFSGAKAAYIVSPPQYSSESLFSQAQVIADTIASAAQQAGVAKLVALSSIGAEQLTGTGWIAMNRMLERALVNTLLPVTFLRAAYFMENWAPLVELAAVHKQFHSFLAPLDKSFAMIATEDIGEIAAQALGDTWQGVRVLELEGPQRYSPSDVADCLADIFSEPVPAQVIAEKDWSEALQDAGFSATALAGFSEMTQALNSSHIRFDDLAKHERRVGKIELKRVIQAQLAG